ncbi:hypothetical protein Tco_0410910 [Tanacetum coccineum]
MSSASSVVTYTFVYTDSKPGRAFWGADDEEVYEGGIPRVIIYGYDGLLIQPAHDPDYVSEPVYPEYIPLEDKHVFLAEEQPLPPVDSPTTESPRYITESDPEEDPGEYEDDGKRITIRPQASMSLPPEAEVKRLLAMTTPSPSPPISLSPPSAGERLARCTTLPVHSSPPPVPSPLLPSFGCSTQVQTLRDSINHALLTAHSVHCANYHHPLYHPPPPFTYHQTCSRYEIKESSTARPNGGRGIDYGFVSMVDAEERRQEIRDGGYGIRDTWIDLAEAVPEVAPKTVGEVNTRVTELAELHKHDTQDLYALLEDAHDSRSRISQRVAMDS